MADNYTGAYDNFVFMAGWRDMLEGFVEEVGMDMAKEALWNIMLLGTTKREEGQEIVIETDKKIIRGFLEGCVLPVLNSTSKNYTNSQKNGQKGGRPQKEVDVPKAIKMHDENKMSWKAVASELGVDEKTLKKARDKYAETEKRKNQEEIPVSPVEPEKVNPVKKQEFVF